MVFFTNLQLYKGQIDVFQIIMFNALTAFSAHNYYIGMYYAFLRILCLTFAPFVYLLLDQDVSMDASKYVKDND